MAEPYCLAMILCDNVHVDSATGKQTILGTFSAVGAKKFPANFALTVYFAITDAAEGETELTFRIVDSRHGFDDGSAPVFEHKFPIQSPSPLAVIEGRFGGIAVLPQPGVYHCELLTGENVLMSRRLVALLPPDAQE
jgi:hypothetical protein